MSLTAYEAAPEEEADSYYWKMVECMNCGMQHSLAFRKGHRISEHSCPDCDVEDLKLVDNKPGRITK